MLLLLKLPQSKSKILISLPPNGNSTSRQATRTAVVNASLQDTYYDTEVRWILNTTVNSFVADSVITWPAMLLPHWPGASRKPATRPQVCLQPLWLTSLPSLLGLTAVNCTVDSHPGRQGGSTAITATVRNTAPATRVWDQRTSVKTRKFATIAPRWPTRQQLSSMMYRWKMGYLKKYLCYKILFYLSNTNMIKVQVYTMC